MQLYSEKRNKFLAHKKKPEQNYLIQRIAMTFGIMFLCTAVSLILFRIDMFESNIVMIYLTGILMVSYFAKSYIFSLITSVFAVLMYNYFFAAPFYTFKVNDPNYFLTFIVMFLTGFITSMLTIKVKMEHQNVEEREEYISLLYCIEKKLLNVKSSRELAKITTEQLAERLKADIMVKLFDFDGKEVYKYVKGKDDFNSEVDNYALLEAYRFGKTCGKGTDVFPGAKAYYKPFENQGKVLGVLGIIMKKGSSLQESQYSFIDVIAPQIAVVLQREMDFENHHKIQMEIQEERLRTDMLRSISHDIRTPLAGLMGLTSTMLENYDIIDDTKKKEYMETIYNDAELLNELVENILQATRFEEGVVKLNINEETVEEIVSEALSLVKKHGERYKINVKIPEDIIFIKADGVLIRQVLVNLLNNAMNYSKEGSEINLFVQFKDNKVNFDVIDNGKGIPSDELPYVFQRYQRGSEGAFLNKNGLGLGLYLCKSIVTAHNGDIEVKRNYPQGTIVSFYIPGEKGGQ